MDTSDRITSLRSFTKNPDANLFKSLVNKVQYDTSYKIKNIQKTIHKSQENNNEQYKHINNQTKFILYNLFIIYGLILFLFIYQFYNILFITQEYMTEYMTIAVNDMKEYMIIAVNDMQEYMTIAVNDMQEYMTIAVNDMQEYMTIAANDTQCDLY